MKLRDAFMCQWCCTYYPAEHVDDISLPDKICTKHRPLDDKGRPQLARCARAPARIAEGLRPGEYPGPATAALDDLLAEAQGRPLQGRRPGGWSPPPPDEPDYAGSPRLCRKPTHRDGGWCTRPEGHMPPCEHRPLG